MKKLFTFFTFALFVIWCVAITSCSKDDETQLPETEQIESENDDVVEDNDDENEGEENNDEEQNDENEGEDENEDENNEEDTDENTPEPDSNTALISQIIWDDYLVTFEYDDQNRLIKYTQSDDEGTATMTYSYDEESKITGTSNYVSVYETTQYSFEILLNSDNTPSKLSVIESGEEYVMCELSYSNGLLSSCNDYLGSWSSSNINIACTWSDGNMVTMGRDKFQYASMDNNYSIDLNMYITNSEELALLSDTFGFMMNLDGIHSKNMISQCTEEVCTYNIVYTTDSEGRITSAKWDKYGKEYGLDEVKYY